MGRGGDDLLCSIVVIDALRGAPPSRKKKRVLGGEGKRVINRALSRIKTDGCACYAPLFRRGAKQPILKHILGRLDRCIFWCFWRIERSRRLSCDIYPVIKCDSPILQLANCNAVWAVVGVHPMGFSRP